MMIGCYAGQTPGFTDAKSKGTNGEFGYLKSLDSDENEIWEVLGHVRRQR